MSEEIKEIIKDEDELIVLYKDNSHRTFDTLTVDVIDYIINLEQENQQLKEKYNKLISIIYELKDYIIDTCWRPGMNNYTIMYDYEVIELMKILDKVKE